MSRKSVISWWEQSPAVLLLVAATLAAVPGPSFLAGVLAAGDASLLYGVFAVAIVLVLLAAAGVAQTGHSRWAAGLSAAASTPAAVIVTVTYGYSRVHSLHGHPFGRAAMLLAAALYLGCIALAAVLAPLKLRAGVEVVAGTVLLVATSIILAFYVLMIFSGGGD